MRLLDSAAQVQVIPFAGADAPCTFAIKLTDRTYRLTFAYNETGAFFTVDLATSGPRGVQLCTGEILRYGKPLFEAFNDERYPLPVIVPLAAQGERIDDITYADMGTRVKLYLFPRAVEGG